MNSIKIKYCAHCSCPVLTSQLNYVVCDKCKDDALRNAGNYYAKNSYWTDKLYKL